MILKNKIRAIFEETGTDKADSHGYEKYYASIFENFIPNSLLEIGVREGRSIAAWSILFPETKITGLDITHSKLLKNIQNFTGADFFIGDSTKIETSTIFDDRFDIIIDDGSHYYKDILRTFVNFKEKFNHVYVIEDLMYKSEFVKKFIERSGEYSAQIVPSKVKNVYVDKTFLENNYYSKQSEKLKIDLFMVIVKRI